MSGFLTMYAFFLGFGGFLGIAIIIVGLLAWPFLKLTFYGLFAAASLPAEFQRQKEEEQQRIEERRRLFEKRAKEDAAEEAALAAKETPQQTAERHAREAEEREVHRHALLHAPEPEPKPSLAERWHAMSAENKQRAVACVAMVVLLCAVVLCLLAYVAWTPAQP